MTQSTGPSFSELRYLKNQRGNRGHVHDTVLTIWSTHNNIKIKLLMTIYVFHINILLIHLEIQMHIDRLLCPSVKFVCHVKLLNV